MTIRQTYTGRLVDIADLAVIEVDFESIIASLAKICRFGGHTRVFYSVAQHSVHVSRLVPPAAARHALLHDAHEAYIGDVVSPVRRALRRDTPMIEVMARACDAAIFEAAGIDPTPSAMITEAVAHADAAMLIAERDQLMAPPLWPPPHGAWPDVPPAPIVINPLPPFAAEHLFRERLGELFPHLA